MSVLFDLYPKDDTMRFQRMTRDGTDFLYLSSDEYHYSYGYYSSNPWINGTSLIVARFPDLESTPVCELAAVDLAAATSCVVATDCRDYFQYVVHGTHLYYMDPAFHLWHVDLTNGEKDMLFHQEGMNFPHLTADGRYMSWARYENGMDTGVVFDIANRQAEDLLRKSFAPPFCTANHMMVCPTNPDCLFFAHEGTTQYISNRLWLAERGQKPRNIAPQKLNRDGDLGDCFGHECWACHGQGLYFVKYACSPEPPSGICYVDAQSGEAKLLWSAYPYWHVSCSPDDRFLGADTQNMGDDYSGVCVVDQLTGQQRLLMRARTNWKHPCHPHPCFNTESDKVVFHDLSDNGKLALGVIDLA